MESIEMVLVMLSTVVASGYVVRVLPFSLPLPLVQIALGAVISGAFRHGVALAVDTFRRGGRIPDPGWRVHPGSPTKLRASWCGRSI